MQNFLRSSSYLYYRLFFVALFLLLGFSSVGIVSLEHYADIDLIATDSETEKRALNVTLSIMGVLGITMALIIGTMLLHIRSNISLLYYRLFFVALFLLLGFSSAGIVVLELYAGINIISTQSETEKQALHVALSIMGMLGMVMAFNMIYFMIEKRRSDIDRRLQSRPTDFTDRRARIDRRAK
jgi:hypothetical protein